jgi:hypothetical protein
MDQEKFLALLAERLAAIPNQFERTAVAMDVAGRSGARLNPLLREIAEKGLGGIRDQAGPMTEEVVKGLDDIGDAISRLYTTGIFYVGGLIKAFAELLGLIRTTQKERLIDELNTVTQESRGIAENLRAAQQMREKGLRSGIAQDSIYNALKRNELLEKSSSITTQLNELNAAAKPPVAPPREVADPDALKKALDLAERQREALARLTGEQLKASLASAELARSQGNLTVDVRAAAEAIIEHERASAILAATHDKTLTPAVRAAINAVAASKLAQFDATEQERVRKENLEILKREIAANTEAEKDSAEALLNSAENRRILQERELKEIEIQKQLMDLQAERLSLTGRSQEAEALRLQAQIANLQKLRAEESRTDPDTRVRDAQILNAQTALQKVGAITVDIGRAVADTMADIAEGLATGTLKGFDIVKAAGSSVLRLVTDIFRQTLQQKLSFELNLFNNLQQLPGQAQNALAAGGGGGGLLQTLLFGAGGGQAGLPAGQQGPFASERSVL